MDGKKRFCPLLGLRPKGGAARHPCIIVLNMTAPQACRAGVSADKPAAVLCLMSGKEKSGFGSGTLSETQAGVWSARISSGWRLVAGRRLKERGNTMKTGNDVFNRALLLLGYTGIDGAVNGAQSAELFRRELDVLNQVMADLWPLEKDEVY